MEDIFDMFGRVFGIIGNYFDEYGKPCKKTKMTHPYNYDAFVIWESVNKDKANNTIYTDNLLHWDYDKHNKLCEKHFGNKGQLWADRKPEKIEKFLRDWTEDEKLELVRVMEHCNQATGYPLWRFDFISTK